MKKLLISLLLTGCLDLDNLQTELCKPECPSGYLCNIESKCVKNNPIVGTEVLLDGGVSVPDFSQNVPECFKYYVPGYIKDMYPTNLPKMKCDKCTDKDNSMCGPGNKVKEEYCMTDANNILYSTDVNGIHYKGQVYAVLNQNTVSESVEDSSKKLCERSTGIPYVCNSKYTYVMWWCDSLF